MRALRSWSKKKWRCKQDDLQVFHFSPIDRVIRFYVQHGLWATLRRVAVSARRALFANRMVLFYCDLPVPPFSWHHGSISPAVDEKCKWADLTADELRELTADWSPQIMRQKLTERFSRGAHLWLVKVEGSLAGFGWTLRGDTIEPHYYILGAHDVHLFDFHVFTDFRGRGINPYLVSHILRCLALNNQRRAFIEVAAWNQPQLLSLRKTPFRPLASAMKWSFAGRTLVYWSRTPKSDKERVRTTLGDPASRKS